MRISACITNAQFRICQNKIWYVLRNVLQQLIIIFPKFFICYLLLTHFLSTYLDQEAAKGLFWYSNQAAMHLLLPIQPNKGRGNPVKCLVQGQNKQSFRLVLHTIPLMPNRLLIFSRSNKTYSKMRVVCSLGISKIFRKIWYSIVYWKHIQLFITE